MLVTYDRLPFLFIPNFSAHGTFLGHIRLEPHKPQQIPIDSTVSFGASTRAYTLREKPQTLPSALKGDEKMTTEDEELKGLLGLPEEETELDVSTSMASTCLAACSPVPDCRARMDLLLP